MAGKGPNAEEAKLTQLQLQTLLRTMYDAKNSDKEAIITSITKGELIIQNYIFYIHNRGHTADLEAVRNRGTPSQHAIHVFSIPEVLDTKGYEMSMKACIKELLDNHDYKLGGKRRTYRNKKNKRKFKKSRKRSYRQITT